MMQLQQGSNIFNALVYPYTPPEQVAEWKGSIEEIVIQFEEMDQDAKNITEAMTQFLGSVIQDEQLEKLTKQLQEAKGKLETLNMALRTMPPIVQIINLAH